MSGNFFSLTHPPVSPCQTKEEKKMHGILSYFKLDELWQLNIEQARKYNNWNECERNETEETIQARMKEIVEESIECVICAAAAVSFSFQLVSFRIVFKM